MIVNKVNFMSKFSSINDINNKKISNDEFSDQDFDLLEHPYIDTFERESCYRGNMDLYNEVDDEFETFEDYGGLSDAYVV